MHQGPILAVDDEPIILGLLRQILEPEYSMLFATNGADALKIAERYAPALILLDIQLDDMSGYRVCQLLKANAKTANIPVIFVTNLSEINHGEAAFLSGCVDYLAKPLIPGIVRTRVKTHLSLVRASKLEKSYRDAIYMLGDAAHYNDDDTGDHIWRMADYSCRLAEACGWSAEQCDMLKLAALMHDTGKIGLPERVLKKPGKLNPEEWAIMQSHTHIGHQILSRSEAPIFAMAAEIALRHHERWDGSGYPGGLAGKDIPESARIVAVADVFDALSMKRTYKAPWPLEAISQYLADQAGKQFDPELIDCFMPILPKISNITVNHHSPSIF